MDIFASLVSRRSIAKVTEEPVSALMLEKIIEAGTFAPVHKRTDPWRFVVFTGEGRKKLSDAMYEGFKKTNPEADAEKLAKIASKPYRAPAIILVWCAGGRGKKNPALWEDRAAVSACLQNMSLAAHGFGLGSIWRSGGMVDYEEVHALCQTKEDKFDKSKGDAVMGVLYIGHPDPCAPMPTRTPCDYRDLMTVIDA